MRKQSVRDFKEIGNRRLTQPTAEVIPLPFQRWEDFPLFFTIE